MFGYELGLFGFVIIQRIKVEMLKTIMHLSLPRDEFHLCLALNNTQKVWLLGSFSFNWWVFGAMAK